MKKSFLGGCMRQGLGAWCGGLVLGMWSFGVLAAAPPMAEFKPTAAQMKDLGTLRVTARSFADTYWADGSLAFDDDAKTDVFSPFSGRVVRLMTKLGDEVKRGQPLMAVAASEIVQAQSDLQTADDVQATATAQVKLAEANEVRQKGLYEAKSGALKDWLQSQSDLTVAQNNLKSAAAGLAAVRDRLRVLGQSEHEIDAMLRAKVKHAPLPESFVVAPIDGTVIARQVGVGQFINSAATGGSTPVFTIGNLSKLWLIAGVRESDAPFVRLGQPIRVHLSAFPGQEFTAKVRWIAPALYASTHRLPIRAELDNPDGLLKAGMFAQFSIQTGSPEPTLAVPLVSVIHEENRTVVCVVQSNGTLVIRPVTIGRDDGVGFVEIKSGLSVGDRVITQGAIFMVRAIEAAAGIQE
ncbi:MAG: efflux RND transporter periplasmic adaptor subunit [Halothiobacillus sp.]